MEVVDVPRVLGKGVFVDEVEAGLCATAEGTAALPTTCLFFRAELVLGMSSYRCNFVGGVECALGYCPRAVVKDRYGVVCGEVAFIL